MILLILFIIAVVFLAIWVPPLAEKEKERELNYTAEYRKKANGQPFCPKCGCTSLSANKKGYSMVTGTIGSKDVYVTCLKCGHRWKAGDYNYLY